MREQESGAGFPILWVTRSLQAFYGFGALRWFRRTELGGIPYLLLVGRTWGQVGPAEVFCHAVSAGASKDPFGRRTLVVVSLSRSRSLCTSVSTWGPGPVILETFVPGV